MEWIPISRAKPKPWERVFVKVRGDLMEPFYLAYLDPDEDEFVFPVFGQMNTRLSLDSIEGWAPIEG